MLIDTQLHIVDPNRFPYDENGGGYIPHDHEAGDLAALLYVLDDNGVDRGVLVQPSAYGSDNAALTDALKQSNDRLRGIAMVTAGEPAPIQSGFAGIRLNLTDYAPHDPDTALRIGGEALSAGLILQVQARPSQLQELLAHLPTGAVILDHLGRPDPDNPGDLLLIAALSEREDTWLKVSGGFRLGRDWRDPAPELAILVANWPAERIMWGSDWPFLNAQDTQPTYAEVMGWAASLTDLHQASANAARLFGWSDA